MIAHTEATLLPLIAAAEKVLGPGSDLGSSVATGLSERSGTRQAPPRARGRTNTPGPKGSRQELGDRPSQALQTRDGPGRVRLARPGTCARLARPRDCTSSSLYLVPYKT